jgi:hypothetical protein
MEVVQNLIRIQTTMIQNKKGDNGEAAHENAQSTGQLSCHGRLTG